MAKSKAEQPSDAAESTATAPGKTRKKRKKRKGNKTELVLNALAALGADASSGKIRDWIREHHRRVSISASHISNTKAAYLAEQGGGGGKGAGANGPGAKQKASAADSLKLNQMRQLKELIEQIGKPQLHEVIDMFEA
jgi:hypothetical protein